MTDIKIEAITPIISANVYVAADDVTNEGIPSQILQALGTYNVLVFPRIASSALPPEE